ncbi:zinc ABC transporter substrate-binding protein [Mycoplasmatota bacterium WC30]
MKKILALILITIASLSMTSCITDPGSYDVYVTVYPMKFVVEEIFEGTGYTVGIVPGVTSHETSVDWSPKEIIAMTEAKYLFYVGANYDQYIEAQINSIFVSKDVELIKIEDETSYIEFINGVVHSHDEEDIETLDASLLGVDPHFWISPLKVQQAAALIYDKLADKFDDPEDLMETNYTKLVTELQNLSDAFTEVILNATQPAMMSTNIYGYLREDYGFEYFSISPGYHEETEQFTSQEKEEIVAHALENNIKYIIYELYTTSPLSNSVFTELDDLGLEPVKLEYNILQSLSDDEIITGNDYISCMYENLELLKLALGYQSE